MGSHEQETGKAHHTRSLSQPVLFLTRLAPLLPPYADLTSHRRHPTFCWLLTAQPAVAATDGSQAGGLPWSASWGSSSWPLMMNLPSCRYPLLALALHELLVAPSKVALWLMFVAL
jgi:hypothetical protein